MGAHAGVSGSSMATVKSETSYKSPPSSISDLSQPECETVRGRRQDRESTSTAKAENESDENKDSVGKPRKRKRSRKGLEKNFPCTHQGCNKSYSRAEHLYRHQLNHTPKKIYECDFPGCERHFVRQDLCARHRERHTARGSHLQTKDPYSRANEGRPTLPSPTTGHREPFDPPFRPTSAACGTPNSIPRSSTTPLASPHEPPSLLNHSPLPGRNPGFQPHRGSHSGIGGEQMRSSHAQAIPRSTDFGPSPHLQRSNSDDQYYAHAAARYYESKPPIELITAPRYDPSMSNGNAESIAPVQSQQFFSTNSHARSNTIAAPSNWRSSPTSYSTSSAQHPSFPSHLSNGQGSTGYLRHQDFPPMLPLPAPVYSAAPQSSFPTDRPTYAVAHNPHPSIETTANPEMIPTNGPDQMSSDVQGAAYSLQGFETDALDRSPLTLPEYFTTWLFDEPQVDLFPPGIQRQGSMDLGSSAFMDESAHISRPTPGSFGDTFQDQFDRLAPQHPMSVTSIVDPAQTYAVLSEEKWQKLLELIEVRFNETDHAPVQDQKETLLQGNRDDPNHTLSLQMMQTYIGSYWYHFHPQMPILHKPTFSPDRAQNLLLVAMIAIGASCLDKLHGIQVTQQGAELSNFLAYHLRWEIFKDRDCTAPAKLWVFQALLLLEVYEKMYSTRLLHERAHIHHATTLTLMRRGKTLIGRSTPDSPPAGTVDNSDPSATESHKQSQSHTPDQWWNHWITSEATRRVAFAAFIIDSVHATMFGHSANMVPHEPKSQLPCHESMWSATSSAEVARLEHMLKESGHKPISFLDGLKSTLNNNDVRTNSFGRTALMAGLLSVRWHMDKKDMLVRSLGAVKALGGNDKWRGTLTKAFDFWKSDFDQTSSSTAFGGAANGYPSLAKVEEENVFESRTVLHHLAHMATHVDIVSCQIFARAKRLLGRTTLPLDYTNAQKRIKDYWAPKPSARDATFYAVKFLAQVLTPDTAAVKRSPTEQGMGGPTAYSARDDFLINRPWVVYVAALIVWSYGYALDGPIQCPPNLSSPEKQTYDMRLFLERVGGVETPDDLIGTPDRNACLGLLYILKEMFDKCRWELLREGAKLLDNCIKMLQGQDV